MQSETHTIRLSIHGKLITIAIIVGVAIFLLLSVGHVLTPFIAAIITAYLFNPLVSLLQRRTRIRRSIWIGILYILIFFLLYSLGTWGWPRIVRQYDDLSAKMPGFVTGLVEEFGQRDNIDLGMGVTVDLQPVEEQVIKAVSDLGRTLSESVPHLVFSALEIAIYTFVYLIVTFYLLLQSQELSAWAVRLIPLPYRAEICDLGHQIDQVLNAYIRGQLLLIVIMSVLTYIPLSILGVPYALVIAIASGVLELIPILGPWSVAGIAMTVAFFQPEAPFGLSSIGLVGLIGLIYFTLRQIEDSFIIPNVVGHLVKLHPAVVIFAILAGGAVGGALGLLVAIPFAAVIRILLTYIYPKLIDGDEPPASLPLSDEAMDMTVSPSSDDAAGAMVQSSSSDPCLSATNTTRVEV